MKKIYGIIIILVLALTFSLGLAACGEGDGENITPLKFEQVYALAQDAGYEGTLEELIEAFKGDSAYQVAVDNGYTGSEASWLASLVGASGVDGKDGITPHIENGYWYIGNVNTSVAAQGADGYSAYEIAVDNGFVGTESQWLQSLIGANGISPHIDPTTGYWFIGSTNLGVKAKGEGNQWCGARYCHSDRSAW